MTVGSMVIIKPNGSEFSIDEYQAVTEQNRYIMQYLKLTEFEQDKKSKCVFEDNRLDFFGTIPVYDGEWGKRYKDLLNCICRKFECEKLDVHPMVTPIMYEPTVELVKLQKLFGLSEYKTDDGMLLRPASDFGVFLYMSKYDFSENELPYRTFEEAMAFRKEEKVHILKRPKIFHLPDMHSFVTESMVYAEIERLLLIYRDLFKDIKIPFVFALRITEAEYKKELGFIKHISKCFDKEIVINVVPDTIRYWVAKYKFLYKGSDGEFLQLATVQVDYSSPLLFHMNHIDAIIHSTPGSMERLLYALADNKEE